MTAETCRVSSRLLCLLFSLIAGFARPPLAAADRPNVLFIAIDDLRNDLGALGVTTAQTPQLDRLARSSRLFSHHYTQVPTCGASRCTLLRGRYPTEAAYRSNEAILSTHAVWQERSLPAWLKQAGYATYALGKITHYPGGMAGPAWAAPPEELPGAWDRSWIPDGPWRTPQAMMHGYTGGKAREPGVSPPLELADAPDSAYPDAWIADAAITQLHALAESTAPWFFAVGFFKPHLPFVAPQSIWRRFAQTDFPAPPVAADAREGLAWGDSGELLKNYNSHGRDPRIDPAYAVELRRAYAAATSFMDAQVGRVLGALEELGLAHNTILVVWSDHGFLVGEHGMWAKHTLYENALRSPLMIRYPGLPDPGRTTNAVVETVDLFPTLLDLCGLPPPPGLDGRSLRPQLENPLAPTAKPALAWWVSGRSVRTDRWRLLAYPRKDQEEAAVELFDLTKDPYELHNVAATNPETVRELMAVLR